MKNIIKILLYLDKMIVQVYHVLQLQTTTNQTFKQMSKKRTFHREIRFANKVKGNTGI